MPKTCIFLQLPSSSFKQAQLILYRSLSRHISHTYLVYVDIQHTLWLSSCIHSVSASFSPDCQTFALNRVITPVILGTMMPSLHPVSCSTCCCRRMPGQGPAPTPQALGQESLEAPWDLDLDLGPMEPPPHTLVKGESHAYNRQINKHFALTCKTHS